MIREIGDLFFDRSQLKIFFLPSLKLSLLSFIH